MKMTIGRKLGGGFGLVLLMLVGVAGVVHVQTGRLNESTSQVVDEAVPAVDLCLKLQTEIHHALSMHRGYMILGLPALAEERLEAWELIDGYIDEIDHLAAGWGASSLSRSASRTVTSA